MRKIAIVGGGVAGLSAAHRLLELKREKNLPLEIALFEKSPRVGGPIHTEIKDGFILEKGPDAFLSEKPAVIHLARRLGLEERLMGTQDENRKSFIARHGALIPVPEGFYLIAPTNWPAFFQSPLFSWGAKIRMAAEIFVSPQLNGSDESVADFVRRRFGVEAYERAGQPMIGGIYTGDPESLSFSAAVPGLKELETKHGSVIRGLWAAKNHQTHQARGPRYSLFLSFKDGMQALVGALAAQLGGMIRLSENIQKIEYEAAQNKWRIESQNSSGWFDALILAVPAFAAAKLLSGISPEAARALSEIHYQSVATVNFAYKKEKIRHPLDGFGFVVPKNEAEAVIACSFSSQKFAGRAPKGCVLLRAFVGGAFGKKYFQKEDADLLKDCESELSAYLGISGRPELSLLSRHFDAMVQYGIGHHALVERIDATLAHFENLYLTGNAFRGVGIPDCIADGERIAEAISIGPHPEAAERDTNRLRDAVR